MANRILSLAAMAARWLPMPAKRVLYRFQPLAQLIRNGLNRAAPHGLTRVRVAAGELADMELAIDLQTEKDFWLGTYEPELQATVRNFVKPGMVAYDVGANIGYITLLLCRAVGERGQVFAFEALPGNVERLRNNVAINGLNVRVTIVPAAVVDRQGLVRFLVGPSGGMGKAEGSVGRQKQVYAESIQVAGLTLDDFVYELGNPAPQVVKMDIEGGEVLALPGMKRVLIEARPLILLELHGPEAARTAWETLIPAGYSLYRMESGYPFVASLEALNWKAYVMGEAVLSCDI
jgi:FkbM family methyltransferase